VKVRKKVGDQMTMFLYVYVKTSLVEKGFQTKMF